MMTSIAIGKMTKLASRFARAGGSRLAGNDHRARDHHHRLHEGQQHDLRDQIRRGDATAARRESARRRIG